MEGSNVGTVIPRSQTNIVYIEPGISNVRREERGFNFIPIESGYRREFRRAPLYSLIPGAFASYTSSNEHTLGSRRWLLGVDGEARVRPLHLTDGIPDSKWYSFLKVPTRVSEMFFVSAALSSGVGRSYMNWGGGDNPKGAFDLNVELTAKLGAVHDFANGIGFEGYVGYSPGGSPVREYWTETFLVGAGIRFGDPKPPVVIVIPPPPCWEDLARIRTDLSQCEMDLVTPLRDEVVTLHGQIEELLADNQRVKEAIQQQVANFQGGKGKGCGDPEVVYPSWKGDVPAIMPVLHEGWVGGECERQLEAAQGALRECRRTDEGSVRAELTKTRDDLKILLDGREPVDGRERVPGLRELNLTLVGELEKLLNWAYECHVCPPCVVELPQKQFFLFVNDDAEVPLHEQWYFRPVDQTRSREIDSYKGLVNPDLDRWIVVLNSPEYQGRRIRIHGFANDTGPLTNNQELSDSRTRNVRNYLVGEGRKKYRVRKQEKTSHTYVPMGREIPADAKDCITGLQEFRRNDGTIESRDVTYCPAVVDPGRIEFVRGYGSNTDVLKHLIQETAGGKDALAGIDHPESPIYRAVWIEVEVEDKDNPGHFKFMSDGLIPQ